LRNILLAFFLLFLLSPNATAVELLKNCNEVLDESNYSPLRKYFSETGKSGSFCQCLNKREFVYADLFNIYYCKTESRNGLLCE
jgi:hypothetical protein